MKTITLSNGKEALVDDEDYERISSFHWYPKGLYAARYVPVSRRGAGDWKEIYMHHEVIQQTPTGSWWHLHHVNENKLDNRKSNLEWKTAAGHRYEHRSTWNSAKLNQEAKQRKYDGPRYKGVSWHAKLRVWQASIMVNGRQIYLGQYGNAEEAAVVYDSAVLHYRNGRGYTNLIAV